MYKIKPNELQDYIGKRVNAEQLDDILDTYIILTDVKLVHNSFWSNRFEGILDSYSKDKISLTKSNSTLIFNDSFERDEYCGYE